MLKSVIKLFGELLLLSLLVCCLLWHQLFLYGIQQGKGQISIVLSAKNIDEVIKEKILPDSSIQKLKLILEIKKFAIDSLGIKVSDNYSTFYDQSNKPKLYTISACEPFSFKTKEWTFPFLGAVSYKGFFDAQEAKKEILELTFKNYDVSVYNPSGWSTLGWFKDPVLSGMLNKKEGRLANLIIHELTHGTLYVKNAVDFNENLANFIGDKGAERFLIYKYGIDSKQYLEYEERKKDEIVYNDYILSCTSQLDSLYQMFKENDSEIIKKEKKNRLIHQIVLGVNRLPLYKKNTYLKYTLGAFKEGNAFFMSFKRYDAQYGIFEKEFLEIYKGDLKKYLTVLKEKYHSL